MHGQQKSSAWLENAFHFAKPGRLMSFVQMGEDRDRDQHVERIIVQGRRGPLAVDHKAGGEMLATPGYGIGISIRPPELCFGVLGDQPPKHPTATAAKVEDSRASSQKQTAFQKEIGNSISGDPPSREEVVAREALSDLVAEKRGGNT